MKRVFSMLVAIVAATMSFAQSSLLATLSHNGEISAYYGVSALQEAYNASQDGDIITLSSGTFTAVDIKKALTLQGTGMQADLMAKTSPTVIAGDFTIDIPDNVEQPLIIEGLYNNNTITIGALNNVTFLKSRFNAIQYLNNSTSKVNNLTIVHCKISSSFFFPSGSASIINSYISSPTNSDADSDSRYEFLNCVIRCNSNDVSRIKNSDFTNCIFYNTASYFYGDSYLDSSNTAYYCIGKSTKNDSSYNMFAYLNDSATNTNFTNELNILFKTYTGSYSDTETFELIDTAKTQYLGNDGKEVGMYGGNLPFDPMPANPRIVKCNVASKSTADGKLSVDIEVSAAE